MLTLTALFSVEILKLLTLADLHYDPLYINSSNADIDGN
jgi:hypothetical protein